MSCCGSIDIPGMFEAKGVTQAKQRLQLLVGDVRQPFPPPAREAQVRQVGLLALERGHRHRAWG